MSDQLRSNLIRLAHENADLRPHILPLLKAGAEKEAASGPTVFQGIMDALGAMAEYVHNDVTRSRFEGLALRPVGRSGSFGHGFSGTWTSQHDSRDTGAMEVALIWDAAKKRPKVYMSARWDRYAKPLMEEVEIGMEESAATIARWVENNIMAFEQNVAYGANR